MTKITLLLLSFTLYSCANTLKKPFYYKATNPEGKVSHILGTMHVGIPFSDLPGSIKNDFENSKYIFVEADVLSENTLGNYTRNRNIDLVRDIEKSKFYVADKRKIVSNHPATEVLNKLYLTAGYSALAAHYYSQSDLRPSANFTEGQSLKTRLTPDLWKIVVSDLSPFYDEKVIEELRVESVENLLRVIHPTEVMVTKAKAQRFDPRWSLDGTLIEEAQDFKKPVISLEKPEDANPECEAEDSLADIKEILTFNAEQTLKDIDDLEFYYREGDEQKLEKFINAQVEGRSKSCMLSDRNAAWTPVVENYLENYVNKNESIFIAVGAAHLVGDKNLLDLLKQKGFAIERVK